MRAEYEMFDSLHIFIYLYIANINDCVLNLKGTHLKDNGLQDYAQFDDVIYVDFLWQAQHLNPGNSGENPTCVPVSRLAIT